MNPYRTGSCDCSTMRGVPPFRARFCGWKANAWVAFVVLLAMGFAMSTLAQIYAQSYTALAAECHPDGGAHE